MFTNLSKKRVFVKENNDNYKVEEMDYQIDNSIHPGGAD